MSKAKIDTKQSIIEAIQSLAHPSNLSQTALSFFEALGYSSERQLPLSNPTYECFEDSYVKNNFHTTTFKPEKALSTQWKYVDFLFQITAEELKEQLAGFSTQKIDNTIIESYLFFVLELEQNEYSRSQLSQITREINKLFSMPVMILFKHDTSLTLAIINRRLHKKDESKDVLEKVTLIKDISTQSPHRAHIEILFDLSLPEIIRKYKVSNFVELHQAWQKTLDTKELNKNFYKELSNWYFWAIKHISFPGDIEKNEEIRNATSLIRLLTRIIFIWFIKEKGLVDEKLFTPRYLKQILHNFDSNSTDSSFYQAILQNLFFATLNQKISERKFAQNGCQSINKKEYGVKTLYRYDDQFAISKEQVLELFKPTPFLNGGLFDCLDKEDESLKVQYADGFSRNPGKRAEVPDFLFFGSEVEVDLNSVYDTKKNKYTSRGLITILDRYKFTITENSPIEEEIALDPELLGKVFENLLASYNPETQTTARKSTGSFYTPREIVHYMVDESLLAYFKQKLEDKGINDSEEKLRSLIGYNEDPNPFNPNESQILIQAVDACKILDPACGSGAFPMGILQKLVHILHKLDPNNQLWKDIQRQKAIKETEEAFSIGNQVERDNRLKEISDIFEHNSDDYGRKLYLIENCIYGIDIQPIAIQIAKLRFFISLIIDQKKQSAEENYGIRALPNLETKFVCANTLIGLDKPEGFIRDPEIEAKEQELKMVRHDYFSSKTREQKKAYQKKDKALREQISSLLIHDGWNDVSAHQVAGWDPYDQNASSPFFDPEWMFGLREGFDIVIGNPPYISALEYTKIYGKEKRTILNNMFASAKGTYDYYVLFIEKGLILCKNAGLLCFITPNKYLSAKYAESLRSWILKNASLKKILDVSKIKVFDEVSVYPIVSFITHNTNNNDFSFFNAILPIKAAESFFIGDYENIKISYSYLSLLPENIWGFILSKNVTMLEKILLKTKQMSELGEINATSTASEADEYGKCLCDIKMPNSLKVINTGTIEPFKSLWGFAFLTHSGKKFKTPYLPLSEAKVNKRRIEMYRSPKVIYAKMAIKTEAVIDTIGEYCSLNTNCFYNAKNCNSIEFIGSISNSKLFMFAYNLFFGALRMSGGYYLFQAPQLRVMPIKECNSTQTEIHKKLIKYFNNCQDIGQTTLLLKINDALIYELYFPEEVESAHAGVIKHLVSLPELKDEYFDEKKLQIVDKVFKELSDPSHPVSIAMKKMKTIPEIRIIEGLE